MSKNQRTSEDLLAARSSNIPRGVLSAHPIVVDRAEGAHIWDKSGRRYLDFVGGIGVINVGHNHPRVVAAVQEQLKKVTHTAFQVAAYEPYVVLAERLNKLIGKGAPYKCALFTTGAEAVENAVKIARGFTNRPGIISFRGGFHGRTLLGVTLTGFAQPYKQNFGPFAPEVFHTPYPDSYRGVSSDDALAALEEVFATDIAPDRVAAIIIEPVQGDGGFLHAPVEFMRALRELTQRHGIVLIVDEIQTGFGRTGKLFGFEHSDIQPDLVTVAKSLAGGFPISAVVGKAEIMDAPTPGGLGGTYGGNAIACAAALAVLDAFEQDGLVERAAALGEKLGANLEALKAKHSDIGIVRGCGFMRAIEFVTDPESKKPDADRAQQVMELAREQGLLVIKCGVHRNIVRFLAPIVLSDEDLEEALRLLAAALDAGKVARAA
ncbi:4-aminobutyrate--2-oxoglutarate transaminase [Bradyrhizobium diazoefficiens]|uniref:4-aminobutyrate--2-oxoglutarate transaminase n=1 Tax=Bradyrhizobium diazoefficiens TaxID=1355477 RepID=UPI00190981A7|nr:4-aminobutyrate--2-oxoglutarate transaminase [Bradyrhizobium diazoefficiens]QQO16759.1 4-aminobutyrate--2-oxoglutarate transaminase [Bradyrhizobium diazoefficiens]